MGAGKTPYTDKHGRAAGGFLAPYVHNPNPNPAPPKKKGTPYPKWGLAAKFRHPKYGTPFDPRLRPGFDSTGEFMDWESVR